MRSCQLKGSLGATKVGKCAVETRPGEHLRYCNRASAQSRTLFRCLQRSGLTNKALLFHYGCQKKSTRETKKEGLSKQSLLLCGLSGRQRRRREIPLREAVAAADARATARGKDDVKGGQD